TREIGILKSLGASRRDIRRQFLAESAMLSLLGGIAGLLAGSALAALVQVASPLPARVTGWSVAVALGLGISLGRGCGFCPRPLRGHRDRYGHGHGVDRGGVP